MSRIELVGAQDVLVGERVVGVAGRQPGQRHDPVMVDESLALFVVSLYNISNVEGEMLNGDALIVRPRGTTQPQLLAAILGCEPRRVGELVTASGTWSIREVAEIDGHRVRFEAG